MYTSKMMTMVHAMGSKTGGWSRVLLLCQEPISGKDGEYRVRDYTNMIFMILQYDFDIFCVTLKVKTGIVVGNFANYNFSESY